MRTPRIVTINYDKPMLISVYDGILSQFVQVSWIIVLSPALISAHVGYTYLAYWISFRGATFDIHRKWPNGRHLRKLIDHFCPVLPIKIITSPKLRPNLCSFLNDRFSRYSAGAFTYERAGYRRFFLWVSSINGLYVKRRVARASTFPHLCSSSSHR